MPFRNFWFDNVGTWEDARRGGGAAGGGLGGWAPSMPPKERRRRVYASRSANLTLEGKIRDSARVLQNLANTTTSIEVQRAAQSDAGYFNAKLAELR